MIAQNMLLIHCLYSYKGDYWKEVLYSQSLHKNEM